jgi:two-component system sensor histidine kinase QseC
VLTSIRKFLLVNLLLAVTITTTLTAIGNYYLDEKDIHDHLDIIMALSALSYQALLGDDILQRPLADIQKKLNQIPLEIGSHFKKTFHDDFITSHYLNKFNFQFLDKQGNILLRSATAPKIPLPATKEGFKDIYLQSHKWRVFAAENHATGNHTVLAERYDSRNELGELITEDDIYIMMLTFPISGLLIWFIIGRGLDSLDRVALEVSNRAPSHLKPVSLKSVPQEIKPVIDELNKLFHRLQEGFEREKRFAADAAHELRTPLAAIKAQAQVALNSPTLQEKNIALEKLLTGINRSEHVVQQLLTMSKFVPEVDLLHDISSINLVKTTQDTLALMVPAAIEKNIELEFSHDKYIPKFKGNVTAISILIRNLVDNAIRYTQPNGQVFVRVYSSPVDVTLEVRDTGPGIPDELRNRVFERFFRVVGNQAQGSGLGLGIVKQISELHHATVTLASPNAGSGLIVSVAFPCHHETRPVIS